MKHQAAILYVLVSLCLAISLATLLLVAQNNGVFNPSKSSNTSRTYPSTTPAASDTLHERYTTNPTTPPTTPSAAELTLTATENKQNLEGDRIKVTYTITAQYSGNSEITITYNQFYLQEFAPRQILYVYKGNISPQHHGTISLSPSHPSDVFQVTFEFGTAISNGMDPTSALYQLAYNGTATTHWPKPYS